VVPLNGTRGMPGLRLEDDSEHTRSHVAFTSSTPSLFRIPFVSVNTMRVALLSSGIAALAFTVVHAAPTITLGSSVVVGVSLDTSRQEFFAGPSSLSPGACNAR
jgi:hypothetical protein